MRLRGVSPPWRWQSRHTSRKLRTGKAGGRRKACPRQRHILLDQDVDITTFTFATSKGSATVQAGVNKFFGSRLPVVKDDDWVYCVEDFLTKVVHDLNWIEFPNSGRRSFTTTWEKVDSVLMQDEDFGKFYKMNNPLAQEQAALNLPDTLPVKERTARLRHSSPAWPAP